MITAILFVSRESTSDMSEHQFPSELDFKSWLLEEGYHRYPATNCKEHVVYRKEENEVEHWVVCRKSS